MKKKLVERCTGDFESFLMHYKNLVSAIVKKYLEKWDELYSR